MTVTLRLCNNICLLNDKRSSAEDESSRGSCRSARKRASRPSARSVPLPAAPLRKLHCARQGTLISPCRAAASLWEPRARWYWASALWTAPRFCRTTASLAGSARARGRARSKHSAASWNSRSWEKLRPKSLYSFPKTERKRVVRARLHGQKHCDAFYVVSFCLWSDLRSGPASRRIALYTCALEHESGKVP